MKLGILKIFFLCITLMLANTFFVFAEDRIESVPLVNLEELSPTFEEDKTELENMEDKNITSSLSEEISSESKSSKDNKIYINLKALDKITAKTSAIRLAVGEKKIFWTIGNKSLKM